MNDSLKEPLPIQHSDGISILPLETAFGSADTSQLAALEWQLDECINDAPVGVVIDLCRTKYVGCAFLSVLIRCLMRAKQRNRKLTISGVNVHIAQLFAMSRLDLLWDLFQTVPEAADSMR